MLEILLNNEVATLNVQAYTTDEIPASGVQLELYWKRPGIINSPAAAVTRSDGSASIYTEIAQQYILV